MGTFQAWNFGIGSITSILLMLLKLMGILSISMGWVVAPIIISVILFTITMGLFDPTDLFD